MILECFVIFLASAMTEAQKVKLKDVDVLTLYRNKLTNGRRSSPIQQLQCRGGSAGCSAFIPDVVQCYNRGHDGIDYQWECKTEMPVEFKFGKVQVSCEGYDYPDDPYILAGSCGLEYTIDRTGVNQKSGYSQNTHSQSYSSNGWNDGKPYEENEFNFGTLLFILIVMFILYRAFFNPSEEGERQPPENPEYTRIYPDIPPAGSDPPPYSASQSQSRSQASGNNWNWTSFGAGWLGNSLWNSANTTTHRPRHRTSGWTTSSRSRSRSSSGGSAGTRTASGFGGTSRR